MTAYGKLTSKIKEQGGELVQMIGTFGRRLMCWTKGCSLYSVMWLSERCEKVKCRRCERSWAMHHELQNMLPWDDELEAFYKEWGTLG